MSTQIVKPWPYQTGSIMTPEVVWTAYTNENRLRLLWEIELQNCARRIHFQREEIRRLLAENAALKATP